MVRDVTMGICVMNKAFSRQKVCPILLHMPNKEDYF